MKEEFKTKLEQALQEPKAPEKLVRRTIRRCQLVSAGRRAEETLASKGNAVTVQEARALAADSILGRMANQKDVPDTLNAQSLVKDERFCKLADRPADQLLKGLQQGTIFQEIAASQKKAPVTRQKTQELRKNTPVKKAPHRSGPTR